MLPSAGRSATTHASFHGASARFAVTGAVECSVFTVDRVIFASGCVPAGSKRIRQRAGQASAFIVGPVVSDTLDNLSEIGTVLK